MDPLADKILTASALICLIPIIPAWVVILIIGREFLITGLRLLASSQNVIIPAERLGKHKTGWQMATVICYLLFFGIIRLFPALSEQHAWMLANNVPPRLLLPSPCLPEFWVVLFFVLSGYAVLAVTVVLTLYSGVAYFWKNRSLIKTK